MTPEDRPGPTATYLVAAAGFVDLVALLEGHDLTGPGLGDWDLRALVGHTSRSIVTVQEYLDCPAPTVDVPSAAGYLTRVRELLADRLDPADVTARGVAAGEALGDDPLSVVRRLVDGVSHQLAGVSGDPVITTIAGGMRLSDYLPTRVFELVVHSLDIVAATGVTWEPDPDALAVAIAVAADAALSLGQGPSLLRVLTGREDRIGSVV
jgi:hypothetical protein